MVILGKGRGRGRVEDCGLEKLSSYYWQSAVGNTDRASSATPVLYIVVYIVCSAVTVELDRANVSDTVDGSLSSHVRLRLYEGMSVFTLILHSLSTVWVRKVAPH